MPKVKIYTTPTCPYCQMAKQFFNDNKVEFSEVDVASDTKAAEEMVRKSGQLGVPVTTVEKGGKEEIVVGFDQPKLSELLNI
ncbi:MAG: NrdH-redoxin [Candidatus Buchananbacteria bacterium RIFCSPHIGHO2_02_FULL_38_8]|uniref:NrdH-redoxin n=2 Tax=Candidatus Buchananiibacteriota TaxID=1817903 RepID=A0A1G1Y312_9BACT|nr:MAG: NrdH-redoxin [Candidatus Buchananbacteria bacterium RIFCSPHIGHO2_01_FULL_39_8]OGY47259.1 MAG: NrdH-redoxin [Candidatus Buchananbacteria bacterium RIFCSPHIGHO2_02_FULL_38_8]